MDKTKIESLEIHKVNRNTQLASKLIDFIKNFSWVEVKEHMLSMVQNWKFIEWETPFVAIVDKKVIGMVTIMKSDNYKLPEIYPWVSSVFVTEVYRGNKISGKLISFANKYAKKIGFKRTYIPTKYIGLYEKYGYKYVKDVINLDGFTRRLYVKEI